MTEMHFKQWKTNKKQQTRNNENNKQQTGGAGGETFDIHIAEHNTPQHKYNITKRSHFRMLVPSVVILTQGNRITSIFTGITHIHTHTI